MTRLTSILLTLALLQSAGVASAQLQPPPNAAEGNKITVDEVRKELDANPREALRKIAQALSIYAGPRKSEDQYALLMLKGEALLRLGERTLASNAFDAAMNAAPAPEQAAVAKASEVIIRLSQSGRYRPETGQGEPVSITDPKTRKAAEKLAFADLLQKNLSRITTALEQKSLPPLFDLLPIVSDLYVLEWASTGATSSTGKILDSMGDHARSLMTSETTRLADRVAALSQLANNIISTDDGFGGVNSIDRRGLWTPERRELQDLTDQLERIARAARRAREVAISFQRTGEKWEPIIAQAAAAIDQANHLWDRRY